MVLSKLEVVCIMFIRTNKLLLIKIQFMNLFLLYFVILNATAQIVPKSPNSYDLEGLKTGQWTILYNSNWEPTDSIGNANFYRLISYNKGIPEGRVIDYYMTGNKQWEGYLLSDYPTEVLDSISIFYNYDLSISNISNWKNGKLDGFSVYYDNKGSEIIEVIFKNGNFVSMKYLNLTRDNFNYLPDIVDKFSLKNAVSICKVILEDNFFNENPVLKSILLNIISADYYSLVEYKLSEKFQKLSLNHLHKNMKIERGLYIDNLLGFHGLKTSYSSNKFNNSSALVSKYDSIKNIDKYLVLYNNISANYVHIERYLNEYFGYEKESPFNETKKFLNRQSNTIVGEIFGIINNSKKHKLIEVSQLQRIGLYYSMFSDSQGIEYAQQAFDLVKNEYSPTDFSYILSEFYLGKAYLYNYYYDEASKYFTSVSEKLVNNIDLFSSTLPDNLIDELYSIALEVFNSLFVSDLYNSYSYDLYSFINSRELRRKKIIDKQFFKKSDLDYRSLSDSLNNIYNNISKCYELSKRQQIDRGFNLEELVLDSKKLETKINQYLGKVSMTDYDIDDITSRLKKDEIFVDIIKVDVDFNEITPQEEPHYFAYIFWSDSLNYDFTNKKSNYFNYYRESDSLKLNPVRGNDTWLMQIDFAKNLDSIYRRYNNYVKRRPKKMMFTSYDKYMGIQLYNGFWYKIIDLLSDNEKKIINNISKIYFSPEGVYSQINPNVLYNRNTDSFLIDNYDIIYVDDITDFVNHKENFNTSNTSNTLDAVIIGNPTFLLSDKNYKDISQNISRTIFDNELINHQRNLKLSNLPGTMKEINQISNLLKSNNWTVDLLSGTDATETNLKNLNSPKLLHIATHGFFFNNKDINTNILSSDNKKAFLNPMTRSGLIFSGAQNTINGELFSDDNGWLNSYEASLLNLKGTELVVLSACDTGMGDVQNGKGVFGLQRAIRMAGAESLIMSMWKVDDKATQKLMTYFYEFWIDKKYSKREAFKKAQFKIREEYNHPYYWGAFLLIGE